MSGKPHISKADGWWWVAANAHGSLDDLAFVWAWHLNMVGTPPRRCGRA